MDNPIIDQTIYTELESNVGADFISELVGTYLDETPLLLTELQQALQADNSDAFRRAAHSIKSSSASFGAMDFSNQAKELEMIGKSGDLNAAPGKIADFLAAYQQVAAALREMAK